MKRYDFFKTKYGPELLIDFIRLESLENFIAGGDPHVLSYFDITIITDGSGTFMLDDQQINYKPGCVIFTSPQQSRLWKFSSLPKGFVIIFEENFLNNFFNDVMFVRNLSYFQSIKNESFIFLDNNEHNQICNIILEIEHELPGFQNNGVHLLRALLYQLLILFDRVYKNKVTTINNCILNIYVQKFVDLVNSDFNKLSQVKQYATMLNITPAHLNDLVNSFLGCSAKTIISDRILLEAKKLLLYTELNINEIADRLSFGEVSYFVRFFKKKTKTTPSVYRRIKKP